MVLEATVNAQLEDLSHLSVWVLTDNRAGHVNQSLGLAHALGFENLQMINTKVAGMAKWLRVFSPGAVMADMLPEQTPDVIIGTGWGVSKINRWLGKMYPDAFTIQLMEPSCSTAEYDVVAAPAHDKVAVAENVITTVGVPNLITQDKLKQEQSRWASRLNECPGPRLAVLIGGASKRYKFGVPQARRLADDVIKFAVQKGYSLLVTVSRRTGELPTNELRAAFASSGLPYYFWDGAEPNMIDNPFIAYLSMAEAAVVTAESVSMISEACSAGVPTYLWGMHDFRPGKFQIFYDQLMQQQRVARFDDGIMLRTPDYPLADTEQVAGFVRGRLLKHLQQVKHSAV